ncbi:MAG: hypothetical protein QOE97_1019 [Pseudonocardiales bacterium]|nr:hypothetical protein [Pseudonocardiales bacterium]
MRARWLDHPARVAAIAGLIACCYMVLQWTQNAHDVSRFIVVGRLFVTPPGPPDVHVTPHAGYDGQFYYRMALAPGQLDGIVNGLHLDSGLRRQRIFYPFLSWVLSAGNPRLIPTMLIEVNLAALTLLAGCGARLAQVNGRHAAWGFAFAGYAGFVTTLNRDLTELTSAALTVAALLALALRRPVLATLALVLDVLTRETAVALVAGIAVWRIWQIVRGRTRPGVADLQWLLPAVAFTIWQWVNASRYGTPPLRDERNNRGRFIVSAWQSVIEAATHLNRLHLIFIGGVLSLAVLVLGVFFELRRSRPPAYLVVTLAVLTLLALSLSRSVWNQDPDELRTFAEIHVLGLAILMHARRSKVLAGYTAVALPTLMLLAWAT